MGDNASDRKRKMKSLFFLIVLLFWLISERGEAQITIHPEAGVSYLNFTLNTKETFYYENPRKLDFVFGLTAKLPIHTKFYMKSRISYCKRGKKTFSGRGLIPNAVEYSQSELSVEFLANFRISDFLEIATGPSIIRSFAVEKTDYFTPSDEFRYRYYHMDQFLLGLNTGLSILFNRLNFHLYYIRFFRKSEFWLYDLGNNRLDLTVSYHLLGGDKGKKR